MSVFLNGACRLLHYKRNVENFNKQVFFQMNNFLNELSFKWVVASESFKSKFISASCKWLQNYFNRLTVKEEWKNC